MARISYLRKARTASAPCGPALQLLVLIGFFCANAFPAGEPHSPRTFFLHLVEDQKQIWTFPVKKESWDSPRPFLLIGLSAASFPLDDDFSRDLRTDRGFKHFNEALASDASDIVFVSLPLLVLAGAELAGNEHLSAYGWKATEAMVDATLASWLLKAATQRARPHTEKVYGFWEGGNSFPSAHATYAWALAAVTSRHFEEHDWVPWVVYPLAGLMSFSRITSGNHFASDAVVGSIIGFAIGRYVVE